MRIVFPILLLSACGEQQPEPVAQRSAVENVDAMQSPGKIPVPQDAKIPSPAEAAKMGRVYLADGSFIHGDHIHKAGQEKCPTDMSGGPVQ